MSKTKIEWTVSTCNPLAGCSKISPGCANCYAERMAMTRLRHTDKYKDVVNENGWTGDIKFYPEALKDIPTSGMCFMCSMSDLFGPKVKREWIAKIMDAIMRRYIAYGTITQLLTKHPIRMAEELLLWSHLRNWHLQNAEGLWLGVTVEGPEYLWRIGELLKIPGFHFVSIEPCLGDVDMTRVPTDSWAHGKVDVMSGYLCGEEPDEMIDPITWKNRPTNEWDRGEHGLDWVIVGPETGPKRRQCNPDWIRSIIEQCDEAGVPCFVKAMPMPDGRISKNMAEWPEWARRRELPG